MDNLYNKVRNTYKRGKYLHNGFLIGEVTCGCVFPSVNAVIFLK